MAWLKSKPSNQIYDYDSVNRCATAQFLEFHGYHNVLVGESCWLVPKRSTDGKVYYIMGGDIPMWLDDACRRCISRTFGELVKVLTAADEA